MVRIFYRTSIIFLTVLVSACHHVVSDMSGTYIQKHIVQFGSDSLEDENILILDSVDKNTIKFCFHLVSTNANMCELRGVAIRQGDEFIFKTKTGTQGQALDECVLNIVPDDETIILKDLDNKCRYYAGCGGLAYINNVYWMRQKTTSDFTCLDLK